MVTLTLLFFIPVSFIAEPFIRFYIVDILQTIVVLLFQLREQNDQILNHFKRKFHSVGSLPTDLPVKLLLKTSEEVNKFESYI